MRFPSSLRRRPVRLALREHRFKPLVESIESRVLLAGGPLTVTIQELGVTSPAVTIADNTVGETSLATVSYSTPSTSPFPDFSVANFTALSNRPSSTTTALLNQLGTVTRTTTTAGTHTLVITVTDTGFTNPTNLTDLTSAASVTFTNETASDQATFQSFVTTATTTTASPLFTLTPNLANNPDSENQDDTANPTSLSGAAPFALTNVYTITLGPSTSSSTPTYVSFQDTGVTTVIGTNNPLGQISGIVYNDTAGNCLVAPNNSPPPPVNGSAPDTPESGVTVQLLSGTTVIAQQVTGADGTYSFTNLPPGTYTVQEITPKGQIETSPMGLTYTVPLAAGQSVPNQNFANFTPDSCTVSSYYYTINGGCPSSPGTSLNNLNVHSGDKVTVYFTVPAGMTETLSFVTYGAPNNSFVLESQTVYQDVTGTFGPGLHSLTVTIPNAYFQIDFVCGYPITHFCSPTVTYHHEDRFIDSTNGGCEAFPSNGMATLSGLVYADNNNSLTFKPGDTLLPGVTVKLTGTDVNGVGVSRTTTTASDGSFNFTNLQPSNSAGYTVTESQPSGYTHEGQIAGSTGGTTGTRTITTVLASGANSTGNDFVELTPPGYTCTSSISSDFNCAYIPAGDTVWFNSALSVCGLNTSTKEVITFTNVTITYSVGWWCNSKTYTLNIPSAKVIIDPSATTASTTFDAKSNTWTTTVPECAATSGNNIFLDGFAYLVPSSGLDGEGVNYVNWQGTFTSSQAGAQIYWQTAAAAYDTIDHHGEFNDLNVIGVLPVDSCDNAGTPESVEKTIVAGGTGWGCNNPTGYYTDYKKVCGCS